MGLHIVKATSVNEGAVAKVGGWAGATVVQGASCSARVWSNTGLAPIPARGKQCQRVNSGQAVSDGAVQSLGSRFRQVFEELYSALWPHWIQNQAFSGAAGPAPAASRRRCDSESPAAEEREQGAATSVSCEGGRHLLQPVDRPAGIRHHPPPPHQPAGCSSSRLCKRGSVRAPGGSTAAPRGG